MTVLCCRLDRRSQTGDRVRLADLGGMLVGDLDRSLDAVEAVGLVGPDAGLQPACLGRVREVDRMLVDAESMSDPRQPARNGHRTTEAAFEHDRRGSTDGSARGVEVPISIEVQIESGAGADIDQANVADLSIEQAERRQDERTAPDLVGLNEAAGRNRTDLILAFVAQALERWKRIAVERVGRDRRVPASEFEPGFGEHDRVNGGEQEHGHLLLVRGAHQEADQVWVGGDLPAEMGVEG